jgi:hypothetical protein
MLIHPAIGNTDPIRYRRPNPDGQFFGNILDKAMRIAAESCTALFAGLAINDEADWKCLKDRRSTVVVIIIMNLSRAATGLATHKGTNRSNCSSSSSSIHDNGMSAERLPARSDVRACDGRCKRGQLNSRSPNSPSRTEGAGKRQSTKGSHPHATGSGHCRSSALQKQGPPPNILPRERSSRPLQRWQRAKMSRATTNRKQ